MSFNFDRLAGSYVWLERLAFGGSLERARRDHLDTLHGCRRILLVGDGDGRFLRVLMERHPTLEVESLDASPAMLARARRRLTQAQAARVTFRCADIRTAVLESRSVDAVVTQFVLDCLRPEEIGPVMARLATALAGPSLWLWADFVEPPHGWRRVAARGTLAILYGFFRWSAGVQATRLPAVEAHWRRLGFVRRAHVLRLGGFLGSAVWSGPGDVR